MDDARDILGCGVSLNWLQEGRAEGVAYSEDREENVDAEIGATTLLEEYSERREDHSEDDLADVAIWWNLLVGPSSFLEGGWEDAPT